MLLGKSQPAKYVCIYMCTLTSVSVMVRKVGRTLLPESAWKRDVLGGKECCRISEEYDEFFKLKISLFMTCVNLHGKGIVVSW